MCWASRTPIERVEIRFSNNTCTLRGCSEFSSSASCGLIFRQLHVIRMFGLGFLFTKVHYLYDLVFWFYFITLFHFQFWGFSDDKSSARRWFFFRPSASRFLPYMFHVLANVTYLPLLSNTFFYFFSSIRMTSPRCSFIYCIFRKIGGNYKLDCSVSVCRVLIDRSFFFFFLLSVIHIAPFDEIKHTIVKNQSIFANLNLFSFVI